MTDTDRMDSQQTDSQELESLRRALEMAHCTRAVYEQQAAGYTTLTVPAQLVINLEEQREKVAALEERLARYRETLRQWGLTDVPFRATPPEDPAELSRVFHGRQHDASVPDAEERSE